MFKKTIVTVTTAFVVGLGVPVLANTVEAETLNDLHNKQSQIQDERSDIKADLSKAEAKIADVMVDLEELNQEIKRTDAALKQNKQAMKETQANIDDKEKEISKLEEAIEIRYQILKERAVSYQKSGGNIGYLDVLFGSDSFIDFVSRISTVTKIAESDKDLLKEIEADKAEVQGKLIELEEAETELKGVQALIEQQKEENEAKREKLKEKKKKIHAMKKKLKVKDSKLATLEAKIRRSINRSTTPVRSTRANTGKIKSLSVSNSSGNFSSAISAGYSVIGTPYVWAGKGPGGFDCSGFVSWAYRQAGLNIPSTTASLSYVGTRVSYENIQPGDLVFFNTYRVSGHVGIYIGGGKFIGAQNSTGVAIADMTYGYWKGKFTGHVRRVR